MSNRPLVWKPEDQGTDPTSSAIRSMAALPVDHCSPFVPPLYSVATAMGNETSKEAAPGYLAKPSGDCCLKGTVHEGEARGSWETIAEVETYIARPSEGQENGNILLYFPDVWGMFPNGLLVMDAFADAGYLVLGLDYFRGVC